MRCPGQDRRYWKEDAVFEVACPKCDAPVELFKDEGSRRCPACGHRFRNPKMSFDCAEWCAYAEECLGFAPHRAVPLNPGEGALATRLIQAIKQEYEDDQVRIAHAMVVFQHARDLLAKEGGDPRVILAAALLLELVGEEHQPGPSSVAERPTEPSGLARAGQILRDAGMDEELTQCVAHILESYRMGRELDTIEFRVVRDAECLRRLAAETSNAEPGQLEAAVESRLRTDAARARARKMLQA